MRRQLHFLVFCVGLILANAAIFNLTIIHTGYVRGGIQHASPRTGAECSAATDGPNQPGCSGGCHRRVAFAKRVREIDPEAIVVDGGGFFWGSLHFTLYRLSPAEYCFAATMYNISAIGGSDLYDGKNTTRDYYVNITNSLGSLKLLSTNVDYHADSVLSQMPVSTFQVMQVRGRKIGFVSVMATYYQSSTQVPSTMVINANYSRANHVRIAVNSMRKLHTDLNIVVLMLEKNIEFLDNSFVSELEGVDIVLLSRAEADMQPSIINNFYGEPVLISPVREQGITFGRLNASFDDNGKLLGFDTRTTGQLELTNETVTYDNATWAYMVSKNPNLDPSVQEIIGATSATINGQEGLKEDTVNATTYGCRNFACGAGMLVVDSMLNECKEAGRPCDIGFLNSGSVRSSITGPSNITIASALKVLPFFNALVSMTISGQQVIAAVVNGITKGKAAGGYPQTNMQFVYNPTVTRSTTVSPADHTIRVMDVKVKNRVTGLYEAIDPAKSYRLVTNTFVHGGGDDYEALTAKHATEVTELGRSQIQAFINFLRQTTAAGKQLNYPTVQDELRCLENTTAPIPSGSNCLTLTTMLIKSEYEKCRTNENFCVSNSNRTFLSGFYVGKPCDECSGVGTCVNRACQCTASGIAFNGERYSYANGIASQGFWAGIQMIRGADCSEVRGIVRELAPGGKAALYLAAAVSIIVAVGVAVALFLKRSLPIIRASSPVFGIAMCVGAVIAAVGIIIDAEPTSFVSCNASLWLYMTGYVVLFASIFMRVHRINYIFNSKYLKTKANYSNMVVMRNIVGLVLIEVVLLILFVVFSPLETKPVSMDDFTAELSCRTASSTLTVVLIVFNVLLMLWGVYLAVRIRHVDAAYNESKHIAVCIYNCAFSCILIMLDMFIIIDTSPGVALIIKAWMVAYVIVSSLLGIFGTKFWMIYTGNDKAANTANRVTGAAEMSGVESRFKEKMNEKDRMVAERDNVISMLLKHMEKDGVSPPAFTLTKGTDSGTTSLPPTVALPNSGSFGSARSGPQTSSQAQPVAVANGSATAGRKSMESQPPKKPMFAKQKPGQSPYRTPRATSPGSAPGISRASSDMFSTSPYHYSQSKPSDGQPPIDESAVSVELSNQSRPHAHHHNGDNAGGIPPPPPPPPEDE